MNENDQFESEAPVADDSRDEPDTNPNGLDPTVGLGAPQGLPDELTGRTLGDYELLEPIGSGGGGRVYKAQHRRMDRIVALKIFSHGVVEDETQLKRFHREVRAAAKLLHRNIVTAFDAGEHQQMHFLVMEYVDGESLGELVRSQGPLSVADASNYVAQAAEALGYAHAMGVVHRDIKPDNIMVDKSGQVKLLDMGLARLSALGMHETGAGANSAELTAEGLVIGTVGFISPEQITDASSVDQRSDVYSLGCTYYFLLTGRAPYQGNVLEVFRAHADAPIPRVTEVRSDASFRLDGVLQRMMAKAPSDRPANILELTPMIAPFAQPDSTSDDDDEFVRTGSQDVAGGKKKSPPGSIGVDVGVNSAHVSVIGNDGTPKVLADAHGSIAVPTAVVVRDGKLRVGRSALRAADRDLTGFSDRITCRLGADESSETEPDLPAPREALLAAVVVKLATAMGDAPANFSAATYTYPSCFGEVRRRAYRDAYWIATGSYLEPVGAATAVAAQFSYLHGCLNPRVSSQPKKLLVFRFGTGSFDATVLNVENRRLTTLAAAGDPAVGESAWDDQVIQRIVGQVGAKYGADAVDEMRQSFQLRRQLKSLHARLSKDDQRLALKLKLRDCSVNITFTNSTLRHAAEEHIQRAETLTNQALRNAGIHWNELDHVLLAGSATRAPMVADAIKSWTGDREICSLAGPEVASGGAALVSLRRQRDVHRALDFEIQEASSHYYGVRSVDPETGEHSTELIINKDAPLPTTAKVSVKKVNSRHTSVSFDVIETSSPNGDDFVVLGTCTIENLPPGMAAGADVPLELSLDAGGILSVFARSPSTGRRESPHYQPAAGMTDDDRRHWRTWLARHCRG